MRVLLTLDDAMSRGRVDQALHCHVEPVGGRVEPMTSDSPDYRAYRFRPDRRGGCLFISGV